MRAIPVALTLIVAGCGLDPATSPTPSPTPSPRVTPSVALQNPASSTTLQLMQRDVMLAYQDLRTLKSDYDNDQSQGSERYQASVHMRFAKPRKVRLDVTTCTDPLVAGASILWIGGATLRGKKQIGFLTINQEHALSEKPCLRGWTFDQTDYHAMVEAVMAGLPHGRLDGTVTMDGRSVVMVQFPSTLKGVSTERVGLDPVLRLPVYRELRERPDGSPVFVTRYHHLQLNADLGKDAFTL